MSALKASNLPVDRDDASTDLCFQRGAVVGRALITRSFAECAFDARIWHYDRDGHWPRWISRLKSPPGLNVPCDFGSVMECYSFSKQNDSGRRSVQGDDVGRWPRSGHGGCDPRPRLGL